MNLDLHIQRLADVLVGIAARELLGRSMSGTELHGNRHRTSEATTTTNYDGFVFPLSNGRRMNKKDYRANQRNSHSRN